MSEQVLNGEAVKMSPTSQLAAPSASFQSSRTQPNAGAVEAANALFDRIDTDGDGVIDKQEMDKWHQRAQGTQSAHRQHPSAHKQHSEQDSISTHNSTHISTQTAAISTHISTQTA